MAKIGRLGIGLLLGILAAAVLFPVCFAVTGAITSQWELEEYLAPVLGGGSGMAKWRLLPLAPTLRSLVELLLDSPQFFAMFWNSIKSRPVSWLVRHCLGCRRPGELPGTRSRAGGWC